VRRARIAQFRTHLSRYLAEVRRGETVIVCDRNTPIARVVPFGEPGDGFVVHEPKRPTRDLRAIRGVRPRRPVDVAGVLRESRDQR
jgi:prevent-host-death family protein